MSQVATGSPRHHLPARIGEAAQVYLMFTVSQDVFAQEKLIIQSMAGEGNSLDTYFGLRTNGLFLWGGVDPEVADSGGDITQNTALSDTTDALTITVLPQETQTTVALGAGLDYHVRFEVVPVLGPHQWFIRTSSGKLLPSNTNDGVHSTNLPVAHMELKVEPVDGRSPPAATVEVRLSIKVGEAKVQRLRIILPPKYLFVDHAVATGCGETPSGAFCTALTVSDGRQTAVLRAVRGHHGRLLRHRVYHDAADHAHQRSHGAVGPGLVRRGADHRR